MYELLGGVVCILRALVLCSFIRDTDHECVDTNTESCDDLELPLEDPRLETIVTSTYISSGGSPRCTCSAS